MSGGRTIFVTIIEGGSPAAEIWRVDLATGAELKVVENANGPAAPLVSSPAPGAYSAMPSADGSLLYYTSVTPRVYGSRGGAISTIMRRSLTSGAPERLALEGVSPMKPVVSRDGRWLVYVCVYEGVTALKVRDLRDGTERWLHRALQRNQLEARADRDVMPNFAITPDGASVLIEVDGRIHRIAIADGRDEIIPFSAQVAMDIPAPLDFPQRVDTGVGGRGPLRNDAWRRGDGAHAQWARVCTPLCLTAHANTPGNVDRVMSRVVERLVQVPDTG